MQLPCYAMLAMCVCVCFFQRTIFFKNRTPHTTKGKGKGGRGGRREEERRGQTHSPDGRDGDPGSRGRRRELERGSTRRGAALAVGEKKRGR